MEIDWRNSGKITLVKNQAPMGSCNAHAFIGVLECMYLIENNLALSQALEFSEAELYLCSGLEDVFNSGIGPDDLIHTIARKGVAIEEMFSYNTINFETRACSVSENRAANSYVALRFHKLADTNAIRQWLSSIGPLATTFTIFSDFSDGTENAWADNIYHKTSGAISFAGHGVLLVGFSDIDQCWICKNSWGTTWRGDGGYFRIGFGEAEICNTAYGLTGISPYVFRPTYVKRVIYCAKSITAVNAYVVSGNNYNLVSDASWITAGLGIISGSLNRAFTLTANVGTKSRIAEIMLNDGNNNIVSTLIIVQAGSFT